MRPNVDAVRVARVQEGGVARDAFHGRFRTTTHVVKGRVGADLLHGRHGRAVVVVGGVEAKQTGDLERQVNVGGIVLALKLGRARVVRRTRQGALEFGFDGGDARRPIGKIAVERGRGALDGDALPGGGTVLRGNNLEEGQGSRRHDREEAKKSNGQHDGCVKVALSCWLG